MKKKKVGIVTLHGYYNYGNRLQNYALKYILENMDFEVSTAVISDSTVLKKGSNFLKRLFTHGPKVISQTFLKLRAKKNQSENISQQKREKIFKNFSDTYLKEEFYSLHNKLDKNELEKFDFFVTGSDQVWNPHYFESLPIYFLTFIESNKRIAYAPSIGREELPIKQEKKYKEYLTNMKSISIREVAGATIIKKLTGKEVPVLMDPTLLLTKEEWLTIAKPAVNRTNKPYILTYFLGENEEVKRDVKEYAELKNMEVINLGDENEVKTYQTGPSEFVDYINNASVFFTDSFHGVAFSIMLETPFIVYERKSASGTMYSRIETILDKFNMRDRENRVIGKDDYMRIDFSDSKEILKKEYDKSIAFLIKSLK